MLQPTVVDLNVVVEGVAKMLARLVGEDVVLSVLTATPVGTPDRLLRKVREVLDATSRGA